MFPIRFGCKLSLTVPGRCPNSLTPGGQQRTLNVLGVRADLVVYQPSKRGVILELQTLTVYDRMGMA